jgi:FKBP-type peptidyl-prolyl cis-trans isomerase (trigger factor)
VTEEDVAGELERLQKRASVSETRDRAVQSRRHRGHPIFEGFVDGVPFEGG